MAVQSTAPLDQDVEKALRYAECRSLGHEWKHKGFVTDEDRKRPFGIVTGMVGHRSLCTQCKTERVKWMPRSGAIGFTRYYHPDGYSLTGEARLTTTEWRRTWLVRELGDDLDMVARA